MSPRQSSRICEICDALGATQGVKTEQIVALKLASVAQTHVDIREMVRLQILEPAMGRGYYRWTEHGGAL